MHFSFISIADETYVEPLMVSIKQATNFYPDVKFYIYNWGLSKKSIEKIKSISGKIEIITWELKLVEVSVKFNSWIFYKKLFQLYTFRTFILNLIKKRTILFPHLIYDWIIFEIKIFNKFLCIKHFNDTYRTNFIFLDADAFIINKFDELLDTSFDLGVTVRPREEWSFKYNNCAILNVGVLFFLGGNIKNTKLINVWHEELKNTHEINCEQTALTRILEKIKPNIFENIKTNQEIMIDSEFIRIRVLPCEIYNYNWIEKFNIERDGDKVKILHLKSGRFKTPLFQEIADKLSINL